MASTSTAACAKHANNYGSTNPIYPPVPPTSMLKIELETLTRTETANISNQNTPYVNIEEWGRGG